MGVQQLVAAVTSNDKTRRGVTTGGHTLIVQSSLPVTIKGDSWMGAAMLLTNEE
jgi:hypothetical protein